MKQTEKNMLIHNSFEQFLLDLDPLDQDLFEQIFADPYLQAYLNLLLDNVKR